MSIKARAVIRREVMFDRKKPLGKHYYAALQLFSEDGNEYGVTRYFSGGFSQVAAFLQSEAGVPHEQLQDRYPRYEKGEEVRIALILENEEAISMLGFGSEAA
jgi:hypothetical protein